MYYLLDSTGVLVKRLRKAFTYSEMTRGLDITKKYYLVGSELKPAICEVFYSTYTPKEFWFTNSKPTYVPKVIKAFGVLV